MNNAKGLKLLQYHHLQKKPQFSIISIDEIATAGSGSGDGGTTITHIASLK